ncbi:helical backbone metal receptor [Alteromonas sp. ASW11-19]|uniref:Helical backbone metal receptor n=1 Tax=Alteromonas salexigens TaxID=2982530 RepID=A0ABT2VQ63_9ALTE|nr:helical backbone metal receptor [Alteromonas salexigens]MCU7555454.1 helical backbone metal receptor [Alteromonas salexigens]
MKRMMLACWVCLVCVGSHAATAPARIVTLAPHLTEWVYSLDMQANLVGVSAYSDFPAQAGTLPEVADYQGINFKALMALQPDLVLAWQGGNKPQDISRLRALGYPVFVSSPARPADIARELQALAETLGVAHRGKRLAEQFLARLNTLKEQYTRRPLTPVFYYSWTSPLMTVGPGAWANQLLNVCGAQTLFADAPTDYPQVSLQEVLKRQPAVLIAAQAIPPASAAAFWEPHNGVLNAPLIQADPDVLSRFTLRLLPELERVCQAIGSASAEPPAPE